MKRGKKHGKRLAGWGSDGTDKAKAWRRKLQKLERLKGAKGRGSASGPGKNIDGKNGGSEARCRERWATVKGTKILKVDGEGFEEKSN